MVSAAAVQLSRTWLSPAVTVNPPGGAGTRPAGVMLTSLENAPASLPFATWILYR